MHQIFHKLCYHTLFLFNFSSEKLPPNGWPFLGKIEFQNFNLRYSLDLPYVLKNLNFQIKPMEKVTTEIPVNFYSI